MKTAAKPTILVVDDDYITRELLKSILRQEGYNVVGDASNGETALSQCETLSPKVVCLDILMPKMDGIMTLKAIKEKFPEIIVIMVSGEATMESVREAVDKGACGFIVKPFNPARILDTIQHCTQPAGKKKPSA